MGAHPQEYAKLAAPHSFIHVDWFQNAKELAQFLIFLDQHDAFYNKFFEWEGTGRIVEFNEIDKELWCLICFVSHYSNLEHVQFQIEDLEYWWRSKYEKTCIGSSNWVEPLKNIFSIF